MFSRFLIDKFKKRADNKVKADYPISARGYFVNNQRNAADTEKRIVHQMWLTIRDVCITVLIMGFLLGFVASPFVVTGESMEPTYHNGDLLFVCKLFYTPSSGDIVTAKAEGIKVVKRVIGTSGDRIVINYVTNTITINDKVLVEPYLGEIMENKNNGQADIVEYIVPKNYVFLLGDNRNASRDSRQFGFVHTDDVIGTPLLYIPRSN